MQGIIKSFEFTFKLIWKTLKDYLESEGLITKSPREVLKTAFQQEIIVQGSTWMEMLDKRNLLVHTYDEKLAKEAHRLVVEEFFTPIEQLMQWLEQRSQHDEL